MQDRVGRFDVALPARDELVFALGRLHERIDRLAEGQAALEAEWRAMARTLEGIGARMSVKRKRGRK
jgi:hypothetical protein